jgi:hypothetical protein
LRARGVKDVLTACNRCGAVHWGAEVMPVAVPTPRPFSKKTPHPTRERGAGQHTDLDSPTPTKTTEEGGGAERLSLLAP